MLKGNAGNGKRKTIATKFNKNQVQQARNGQPPLSLIHILLKTFVTSLRLSIKTSLMYYCCGLFF